MVRFGYTIYYVSDVMQTIEFFENSFGFKRKFIFEDNSYGELDTGTTVLAFSLDSNLPVNNKDIRFCSSGLIGCEIALICEDVEESFNKALKFGAIALEKPEQKPWGQIVGYVKSSTGVLVEICSEVQQ